MAKKAVVIGGCRGIGRAVTETLYRAGYLTYATYCSSGAEAEDMKRAMPYLSVRHCDVTLPGDVEALSATVGGADALVNVAGAGQHALLCDTATEEFDRLMKVNLYGTFYACRAFLPGMIKKGAGAIVNISSIWGISGASMEVSYSAAKAGVIGLTKALAKECGASGIRVNCVAPGYVETAMNSHLTPEEKDAFFAETPLGRAGTAEEIASAVAYLLSDEAAFITGQVLSPNGGVVI